MLQIVLFIVDKCFSNPHGSFCSINANFFFQIAEHHIVNTFGFGHTCSAKASIHPRKGLNFQSNVLNYVSHPGAFFHTGKKASLYAFRTTVGKHAGQQFLNPFAKSFDHVGWLLFHILQIQTHLN
ncbi:hypothetical protein D3C73_1227080 [compost metagenome]